MIKIKPLLKEGKADEIADAIVKHIYDDAKTIKPGQTKEYLFNSIKVPIKGVYAFAKAEQKLQSLGIKNVHFLYDFQTKKF